MPRPKKKPADPIKMLTGELIQAQRFLPLDETDPVAYLEARRLEYVKRIEAIADAANRLGTEGLEGFGFKAAKELELKALLVAARLTSLWKSRVVDEGARLGLIKAPNLANLSEEELKKLEAGEPLAEDDELQ